MEFAVTMVQMPTVEGDREKNFEKAKWLLQEHEPIGKTHFILLPELFAIGFRHEDYRKQGAGIPGPTTDFLIELAEEKEAYTIATGVESSGDKFFNTLVVASPKSGLLTQYRKIHPFQEERDIFDGGNKIILFEADKIKVGVQTCYDIRFPEVMRKQALEGAEIVLIPAAFPDPRSMHWDTLVRARAIENQLFVAATNRVGHAFDGKTYFGHSQLIDPWGVVMTRINSEERVITKSGHTRMIQSVREQITCYADRAESGYDNVEWHRE